MKVEWNEQKNSWLKDTRGISFEKVEELFKKDAILDIIPHPHKERYPNQKIAFIKIRKYVYYVPFVIQGEKWFLKTIIPSRRATRKYLTKGG